MAIFNRDVSTFKTPVLSQMEVSASTSYPVYVAPSNKQAYVKKIIVTNNTGTSGTFDISLHSLPARLSNFTANYAAVANYTFVFNPPSGSYYSYTTAATYSTDSITWNTATLPAAGSWGSIASKEGKYVAVNAYNSNGTNSNASAYSTNGISWSTMYMPVTSPWSTVKYVNNSFFATSPSYSAISTDGITWTYGSFFSYNTYNSTAVYANHLGLYLMQGSSANTMWYSTNGLTWSVRQNSSGIGPGFYSANILTTGNYYSRTGFEWYQSINYPLSGGSIAFGNSRFVAISSNVTTGAVSVDGITWSTVTLPSASDWRSISYGNGLFVAVAANSTTAATSTDGTTWTTRTLSDNRNWTSVAYPSSGVSEFSNENYIYKSTAIAANTTQTINYEIIVPAGYEIRVRSTVPVQVAVNGQV